jgi:Domain of unknown function (DUF4494)
MVKKYYQAKVNHVVETEDGAYKRITSTFLVEANGFGEAETSVLKFVSERPQLCRGEYEITSMIPTKFIDLFLSDKVFKYFSCKAKYYEENENGKMLPRTHMFLVEAESVKEAESICTEALKSTILAYEMAGVMSSQITEMIVSDHVGLKHANYVRPVASNNDDDLDEVEKEDGKEPMF